MSVKIEVETDEAAVEFVQLTAGVGRQFWEGLVSQQEAFDRIFFGSLDMLNCRFSLRVIDREAADDD